MLYIIDANATLMQSVYVCIFSDAPVVKP